MTLRGLPLVLILTSAVSAQTAAISVVSAASYQSTIAPDSLATIFGLNLARATALATLDASGQLPTELAATRVEINGQPAPLFYVSPAQINFVVPAGTASGTTAVLVRSTDTGVTRSGAVTIAATAPGIFSSDASSHGPGAILNAVTFRPSPFLVVTPENGPDPRTRLAVYGTGFRNATTMTATATDSSGNRINLTVEFAGAAPGFFGLDQLNFIVPAQLDGAGTVALVISSEDSTSNTVTFQMNLLPAAALQLAGVSVAPPFVTGGASMTATVSLNGVARAGGFSAALRSTNLAAQVAAAVTIPEGKVSVDALAITTAVGKVQTGSIVALAGGVTLSADFEVDPPNQAQLSGLTITPGSALGGRSLSGKVTLASASPASGVNVLLASDNAFVRPPAVVVVPFGQSSANFTINTVTVISEQDANITATVGRTTVSAQAVLLPAISLSLDQTSVIGGTLVTGTITLAEAPPAGGAQIMLTSSDGSAAQVPVITAIPAGATIGTFTITTSQTIFARTAIISAIYGGLTRRVSLTVNPVGTATLSGLSISPDHVTGGIATQGTVTLTAPAGAVGFTVALRSSALSAAQVPVALTVPPGQSSATFTITTTSVAAAQTVTITATSGIMIKTATLTVQ